MKKRLAKLISLSLVGVMAISLAACGGGNSENNNSSAGGEKGAKSDVTVGIVVKTATNAHFQDIAYGAAVAGEDLGVNVEIDNTATESDIEGQITKCENLISKGVDALILTPNDSKGVSGAVEAAHTAGIPFVTVDTEIDNIWGDNVKEYLPNYIGVDHTQMAYEMIHQVLEKMGGKGNVVILRGMDAASSSQERTAGIEKAISEFPDVKVVESQSANYDQDTAATKMANILQAHSDVDAVFCCNDLMAMGAITALKEQGKEVGGDNGVIVTGIDGNVIALESIKNGELYATAYDWSILQGYYAVEQAVALINDEEVPETTMTPDTVITSENIDDYLPHGEELSQWKMGTAVGEISDYMRNFIEMGEGLSSSGDAKAE